MFIAVLGLVIALITMVVAQLSWRGWVSGVRAMLRGEGLMRPLSAAARAGSRWPAELRARLRDLEDEYRRSPGAGDRRGTPTACARCCARSCAATR